MLEQRSTAAHEAAADLSVEDDTDPPVVEAGGWRHTLVGGVARTARPRHWIKNTLVFAAPGAAGILFQRATAGALAATLVAWCLVSSGTYFLNDAVDAERDRAHPKKRLRPVAAGIVPAAVAVAVGAALMVAGLATVALGANTNAALTVGGYAGLTICYSLWLKHEPVIELVVVSSGFVLRAISGGAAADVPISNWFFIVASFGSLFMVSGKRQSEHSDLSDGRGEHRSALDAYTADFLRYVRSVSSSVAIAAYCLWAFEQAEDASGGILFQLSVVPFVAGMLRYALVVDAGKGGGAPEEVVLTDRPLQVVGATWVAVFALAVHAA